MLWMSLTYCASHACRAIFENNRRGFFAGLGQIVLGAGGIQPLMASFVGDRFDQSNEHPAKMVFDAFYWIINSRSRSHINACWSDLSREGLSSHPPKASRLKPLPH
jgi:dipeptide/tripeptide permease